MNEQKEFIKYLSAGIFFLIGLFLIGSFIFAISKDKGLAKAKFQVTVLFRNVGGLTEGAPTRLSGVSVGNVASIDFLEKAIKGRKVKVILNIFEKYKNQLQTNARFVIKTEGILGEKLIEIYTVDQGGVLNLTQPVIGEDPLDVQDIAEQFSHAAASFTKTSEEMSKINMLELSEVMIESSKALLGTAEGLNSIMGEMDDITQKAKRLFDRVEQKIIDGNLFKVF